MYVVEFDTKEKEKMNVQIYTRVENDLYCWQIGIKLKKTR